MGMLLAIHGLWDWEALFLSPMPNSYSINGLALSPTKVSPPQSQALTSVSLSQVGFANGFLWASGNVMMAVGLLYGGFRIAQELEETTRTYTDSGKHRAPEPMPT